MRAENLTTTAFLNSLQSVEPEAPWSEFDRRYRPMVVAFARRLGLNDQDAADAAQDTMLGILQQFNAGVYSRQRGRLRAWILTVARTRVAAIKRRRQRLATIGEGPLAEVRASRRSLTAIWETERRRAILRRAMTELREASRTEPHTLRAFELLCVHRLAPEVAAEQLGVPVRDVYLAKFRVARRLRAIASRIESSYSA